MGALIDRNLQDFSFSKDGSTGQKLDILENMMLIKENVTMIGDFTDNGPKLFSEKAAGNVFLRSYFSYDGILMPSPLGFNLPSSTCFYL